MSDKNVNRFVAFVILILVTYVFFSLAEDLVKASFEIGPLSVGALPYAGGILLASVLFFLMSCTIVEDIISGQAPRPPEG